MTQAMGRFVFTKDDPVFRMIQEFQDILCEEPFFKV